MLNVLFSAKPAAWAEYEHPLNAAFERAGIAANLSLNHAPEDVDYIIFAPNGPVADFRPYTKTKAVMGLWAVIIAATLFAAMIPLFLGLFVALPVLGHATWHLYRRALYHPVEG